MCTIIRKARCHRYTVILEWVKLLGSSWSNDLRRLFSRWRRPGGRSHRTGVSQCVKQTVDSVPQRSEFGLDVLDALGARLHGAALARNQ
jgi:hypothetical protein